MSLIDLLRALRPNGWSGLEGLVAQLLGQEFELRAIPEPSGPQHGRDIGLIDMKTGEAAPIDIEVKRYQGSNSLSRRELLGELTETRRDRPDTELWVLVATVPVGATLVDALQDEAFRNGYDILILDCAPNGVSALEILLARNEAAALAWIGRYRPDEAQRWSDLLVQVRQEPAYAFMAQDFAEQLRSRYAPRVARARAREWLLEHVEGRRTRVMGLNQALGRSGHAPAIPRPRIEAASATWLAAPRRQTRMLALLGAEGDGKTWSAIDLLLQAEDCTPLVATSNMFDDGGAESLLARALARQCGGEEDRWRSRLVKNERQQADRLKILLLIDGLNEAPHRNMDATLMDLLTGQLGAAIDVVVTSRTPFWTQRVEPYLRKYAELIDPVVIGPFAYEDEWPLALTYLGPGAQALPPATVEALRNPRLWSFAYDLKDQLGGIEEVTLERLLVEHWRLRCAERSDLKVGPLEFNRLIANAVESLRKGSRPGVLFDEGDLDSMLRKMAVGVDNFAVALGEIRDGVFFSSTVHGRLKLRAERVPASLGLLLAQTIIEAGEINPHPDHIRRAAAVFLDDLPASDRVELIIRMAIVTLLTVQGDHSLLLPTLLRHWVTLQNLEGDFYRALAIVVGAAPRDAIRAIEDEAGEDEFVGDAAGELVSALIGRRDRPGMDAILLETSERWLRSFSGELMPGLDGICPDLEQSPVRWVASLDDRAAAFLAYLPIERWHKSIEAWGKRRRAMDELFPSSYHYDQELRWLGLSNGYSDADIAALLHRMGERLTVAETLPLEQLLNGVTLQEWSRAVAPDLNPPRWEEIDTMLDNLGADATGPDDPVPFLTTYRDESPSSTDHWLQLERSALEQAPERLEWIVRSQLRDAERAIERNEVGGFAQFVRDHGLLLGASVQPLIRRYVQRSLAAADDRGGASFAGRAVPAMFFGAEPERHRESLASLGPLEGLERLDRSGYVPSDEAPPPASADAAVLGLWLSELRNPQPIPADLRDRLLALLVDNQARALWPEIARALRVSEDPQVAAAIAAGPLDAASLGAKRAGEHISAMILAGSKTWSYPDLRRRVAACDLGRAAQLDGTSEAAEMLMHDFNALLVEHSGTSIALGLLSADAGKSLPLGEVSLDFRRLALANTLGRKGKPRDDSPLENLAFSLASTRTIVDAISAHQPDYPSRFGAHLAAISDGAFGAAERATFLVSALAEKVDPDTARGWMMRLANSDHGLTDFHG